MKKIFFLVFIMLYSCNCRQVDLKDSEKEWLNPYKRGDILVFKSNRGNVDTLFVTEKNEFFTNEYCEWFTIGNTQNQGINIDLKSNICHNESYCESEISIIKSNIDKETAPFFRIFGLEFSDVISKLIKQKVVLSTTGKIYNNSYLFQSEVNANNYGNNYLKSFFWDKKDGLIKYESNDGEIFEISSNTPSWRQQK